MSDFDTRRARLREVIGLFLKFGATAFGGPAAHIALMRDITRNTCSSASDEAIRISQA